MSTSEPPLLTPSRHNQQLIHGIDVAVGANPALNVTTRDL
jgi:hypothetical protein